MPRTRALARLRSGGACGRKTALPMSGRPWRRIGQTFASPLTPSFAQRGGASLISRVTRRLPAGSDFMPVPSDTAVASPCADALTRPPGWSDLFAPLAQHVGRASTRHRTTRPCVPRTGRTPAFHAPASRGPRPCPPQPASALVSWRCRAALPPRGNRAGRPGGLRRKSHAGRAAWRVRSGSRASRSQFATSSWRSRCPAL
jgi:hypothetical protein